jgi:gentisate 1,2-dioxygenase
MTTQETQPEAGSFYDRLAERHYGALWRMKGALTPSPATAMVPYLWRYAEARALVTEAGSVVTAEEADRRVIAFNNPGTRPDQVARATDTLWAALQLVLPGEYAPVHRHTPAALRFVIEGRGGWTNVDGTRYDMEPGDLILTPNWTWHGHGVESDSDTPVIWLDGLDLPMVHGLPAVFAEFTSGNDIPPSSEPSGTAPRAHAFPFTAMRAELEARRGEPGDPFDDVIVEYRDPVTGGPIMPTLSAAMQLLRSGTHTASHRHAHSVVYYVVSGSGESNVGGRRLTWSRGDTFAVPTWAAHNHINMSGEDALLFSFSDAPALEALGLAREEAVADTLASAGVGS